MPSLMYGMEVIPTKGGEMERMEITQNRIARGKLGAVADSVYDTIAYQFFVESSLRYFLLKAIFLR